MNLEQAARTIVDLSLFVVFVLGIAKYLLIEFQATLVIFRGRKRKQKDKPENSNHGEGPEAS